MSKEQLTGFLQRTGLVSIASAKEIAGHFTQRTIAKSAFLLTPGQISDDYLFLERGCLRAFALDTEGNEVTTGFYLPGQIALEASSFFNRTRSKESIQALTDCEGHTITYEQLNHLFHTSPEFREFGRSVLVSGFTGLKTRMLSMITETAEERYAELLKANPEIFQQAPLKHIASYLGITDTSLSRIRKELSRR